MPWRERMARRLEGARRRLASDGTPRLLTGLVLFVAAVVAFRWARSAAGYWGVDDAAVTYAAAFQLADHGTLAPYLGGTPVEGYSNPLLFFVVTLLRLFRAFNPVTTHVPLEAFVFAWMVVLVWSMLRARAGDVAAVVAAVVFAALELVTPATWIWYGSGLENVWVSAGLIQLLWICERTARGVPLAPAWGAVAFLVAITRPEAPVFVAAFYFALALFARPADLSVREHALRVGRALAVTSASYVAFLLWRRLGYGDWMPNTYYAKLSGPPDLERHLREYVVGVLLPYCRAGLFAASLLALLVAPTMQGLAPAACVLLVASLALPLTAGADWMGEHRFATPFFAMAHASYAALVAVCVGGLTHERPRRWSRAVAVAAVLVVPALLKYDRIAVRDPVPLLDVSIAKVAELQGGRRWEHQARLGLPNAVVLLPDAGGSLLVGAMQIVDDGYLTDFQMARIGRNFGNATDLRVLNQYENEERRPDLVDPNINWPFDHNYLGRRYLAGPVWRYARRDLVEVVAVDPHASPLYDDGHLRLYASEETVKTAAPGGLVRVEIIVAWQGGPPDAKTILRAHVQDGDGDEISLAPYDGKSSGIERRALLVGAPGREGSFPLSIDLVRDGEVAYGRQALTLQVTRDERVYQAAARAILDLDSATTSARRLARLREQSIPRLGMTAFHDLLQSLTRSDADKSAAAGAQLMKLRWQARLAAFERLPAAIRDAERLATHRLLGECARDRGPASYALCAGRAVDELRRQGYFDVLSREPQLTRGLDDVRRHLDSLSAADRYRALVGLTLALPSSIPLQRALLRQRLAMTEYPEL